MTSRYWTQNPKAVESESTRPTAGTTAAVDTVRRFTTDSAGQRDHLEKTAAVGPEEPLLMKLKAPDARHRALFEALMEEGLQSGRLARGADVQALQAKVSALKTAVSALAAATGGVWLTNLASQVLLRAIHGSVRESPSARFKSLEGDLLESVRHLAKLTGMADTVIIDESDQLITLRSKELVHHGSCQQLDQEVQKAVELLQRFPELRATCWWASWVVLNYRSIKAAFPSRFA